MKEKYDIIPIYIAKDIKMYCGDSIIDITQYQDIENLLIQQIDNLSNDNIDSNSIMSTLRND